MWSDENITVMENSGITDGLVIENDIFEKYTNNDLDVDIIIRFTSGKDNLRSKEIMEERNEAVTTRTSDNNTLIPKSTTFSKSLQCVGITSNIEERGIKKPDIININPLKQGWAAHSGNYKVDLSEDYKVDLSEECILKLIQLYEKGKGKIYIVTTECAYDIVGNETIPNDWTQKIILPVPTNSIILPKTLDGMQRLLNKISNEEDEEAFEEVEIEEINNSKLMEDRDYLQDNLQ